MLDEKIRDIINGSWLKAYREYTPPTHSSVSFVDHTIALLVDMLSVEIAKRSCVTHSPSEQGRGVQRAEISVHVLRHEDMAYIVELLKKHGEL